MAIQQQHAQHAQQSAQQTQQPQAQQQQLTQAQTGQPVQQQHTREQEIELYGWAAVPRSNDAVMAMAKKVEAPVFDIAELEKYVPQQSQLAQQVEEYARENLAAETYNHSNRVFLYGMAIAQTAFPQWLTPSFVETYYLTCLLHDIGTSEKNMSSTLLSFEFHGGITALTLFQSLGAPKAQAESVAEAIIRHQDLGEVGTVTQNTALTLLGTLLDNVGENPHLVSRGTIQAVVRRWPRMKWSGCFSATIKKEIGQKPWCHSTHIEDFTGQLERNKLMIAYE